MLTDHICRLEEATELLNRKIPKEEAGVSPGYLRDEPKEEQSVGVGIGDPGEDSQGSLPLAADRQPGCKKSTFIVDTLQ